jgi:hypothetical protein
MSDFKFFECTVNGPVAGFQNKPPKLRYVVKVSKTEENNRAIEKRTAHELMNLILGEGVGDRLKLSQMDESTFQGLKSKQATRQYDSAVFIVE